MNIYQLLAGKREADQGSSAYSILSGNADPAEAAALRCIVESAAVSLPDETALQAVSLFPLWNGSGLSYQLNERVRFGGKLWRCLQEHISQPNWQPEDAPSLWAAVLTDPEEILDWVQPDSTNAYNLGDKVRHNGAVWVSDLDRNVWEPGVYGWTMLK